MEGQVSLHVVEHLVPVADLVFEDVLFSLRGDVVGALGIPVGFGGVLLVSEVDVGLELLGGVDHVELLQHGFTTGLVVLPFDQHIFVVQAGSGQVIRVAALAELLGRAEAVSQTLS